MWQRCRIDIKQISDSFAIIQTKQIIIRMNGRRKSDEGTRIFFNKRWINFFCFHIVCNRTLHRLLLQWIAFHFGPRRDVANTVRQFYEINANIQYLCGVDENIQKFSCSKKQRDTNKLYQKIVTLAILPEACNQWRDPFPWLSAWTTQLRKNIVAKTTLCLLGPTRNSYPLLPHR